MGTSMCSGKDRPLFILIYMKNITNAILSLFYGNNVNRLYEGILYMLEIYFPSPHSNMLSTYVSYVSFQSEH